MYVYIPKLCGFDSREIKQNTNFNTSATLYLLLLSWFRSGSTLWRSTSRERMMFWCWEATACGMSSPTRRQRKRSPLFWQTAIRMTVTGTFPSWLSRRA